MQMKNAIDIRDLTTEEWLELRRKKGLGGSDAAAACFKSRFKSPYALYREKIGEYEPIVDSEKAHFGKILEDIVAKEFETRTGKKVWKVNQMIFHPEYDFMFAEVDRRVVGENAILECKTTDKYNLKEWTDDEVPEEYIIQAQHYLAVTNCEKAYFAVLIGGNTFKWYEMERDEELIQDIIEMEKAFWHCVQTKTEPVIDGSSSTKAVLDAMYPPEEAQEEQIQLSEQAYELSQQYEEIKDRIKELEDKKNEVENKLKKELGEFEAGSVGDYVITWKPIVSKRFNSKAFKSEYPDLYEQFKKESSYRRFMIKRGE
jgi:putative phage-type endonuclease